MKILIGIPSYDMVYADFAMSLCTLVSYTVSKGHNVAVVNQKCLTIDEARQRLAEMAVKMEFDKLLFLDADMTFPKELIINHIVSGKDIIACDYLRRKPPYDPVAGSLKRDKIDYTLEPGVLGTDGKPSSWFVKKPVIESVAWAPTGSMLIDASVFKRIPEPWFKSTRLDNGQWQSEDAYFCEKAIKAGFEVFVNKELSLFIGHLGIMEHNILKHWCPRIQD